jgi:hypothetical protein
VRTALRLGFQIVAYEHAMAESGESMATADFQKKRDRGQAANLAERVFQEDPNAKLVVHAGYSHIYEKESPYWSPMAMYFRQLTGIDPVTVEQTEMSERSAPEREAAEYHLAESRGRLATPVVLRNAEGRVYVGGAAPGMVDVQVFSPRSVMRDGRPQWLALEGKRRPCTVG